MRVNEALTVAQGQEGILSILYLRCIPFFIALLEILDQLSILYLRCLSVANRLLELIGARLSILYLRCTVASDSRHH